jgi:hypothetical protein
LSNSVAAKGIRDYFSSDSVLPEIKKALDNGILEIKHIQP